MAPLILHNVPDDECYVGDDGIKRPYAMIFNQNDGGSLANTRSRRNVAETGSFGKSTRRSRSRTATPARGTRENPTLAAADKLFGDWVSNQASSMANNNVSSQRKGTTTTQQQQQQQQDEPVPQRAVQSTPVEMILRGYRSSAQQYAAIAQFEDLAGLILEDYPRDPPSTQRRYKSDLRDPAFTRRRNLSPEERALVHRADGGEHWVKVTFESSEAANAAIYASPQRILGHSVYAEPYRGIPPAKDEACPDLDYIFDHPEHERSKSMPPALGTPQARPATGPSGGGLPTSFSSRLLDLNAESRYSSETLNTATLSPSRASSTTVEPFSSTNAVLSTSSDAAPIDLPKEDSIFCRRIPTARRARLLPAEQALLPQQSVVQRVVGAVPFIKWFSGSMIGNEVPRTETGEFDWNRASLYWKIIWWLDSTFGLFSGDVSSVDKDD